MFAECTRCGSYGTVPHLQPKQRLDPVIEAAVERHTAHMMALRAHFTTAANGIARQVHDGSMTQQDGTSKVRELWLNHVAQVQLGTASMPDPTGKVAEFVAACPWCNVAEQVDVEVLPDDIAEPKFASAVAVATAIAVSQKGK